MLAHVEETTKLNKMGSFDIRIQQPCHVWDSRIGQSVCLGMRNMILLWFSCITIGFVHWKHVICEAAFYTIFSEI